LDEKGESVLLLPRWVSKRKYEREECEPIQSQLTDTRAMAEQVLVDVYAGFSRTREALTEGFLPLTLYKAQYREANIGAQINRLVTARNGAYVCDCMDFAEHGGDCKHILCVRLSLGEPEVSRIAKRLRENKNCAIRESLPSLWFGSHSVKEDS